MPDKVKCNMCSKLFTSDINLEQHKKEKHPKRRDSADLLNVAEDRLYEFLSSDGSDRNLRELATKAVIVYNAEARREASINNKLTAALVTARAVTADKNEIRRIIRKALPGHPIADALGDGLASGSEPGTVQ